MVINVVKSMNSKIVFHLRGQLPEIQRYNLSSSSKHLSDVVPYENNRALSYAKNKLGEFLTWYEHFTGLDEVKMAQNRVLEAEERFIRAQEKRRDATVSLSEINNKLKELYAELDNTTRGEDRYVYLIQQEHKLLKEEKAIQEKFSMAEKEERDYFSALSSSVKDSHEKERAQAERTKYWSIIGSVIGTVIGIVGTSFNNHLRMKELKQLIRDSSKTEMLEHLRSELKKNDEKLENYLSKLSYTGSSNITEKNIKIEELLNKVNHKLSSVENSVKSIENNESKKVHMVTSSNEAELFVLPFVSLSETLHEEHKQTRILLIGVAILSFVMPFIAKYYY